MTAEIKAYIEHPGKVVETDKRFKHVMAIALNPLSGYKDGITRCIKSREGNVRVKGYVDRSVLCKVKGDSLERFTIGDRLSIKNESEIIEEALKFRILSERNPSYTGKILSALREQFGGHPAKIK